MGILGNIASLFSKPSHYPLSACMWTNDNCQFFTELYKEGEEDWTNFITLNILYFIKMMYLLFSDKNHPHAPHILAGMVDSLLAKTDFETEMESESFPALVKAQIDDAVSIVPCKDDLSGFGNSRTFKYEAKYYYSENPLGGIETPIPYTGGTLQHISYAPIVLFQSSFPQMNVPSRIILLESLKRLVTSFKESPDIFDDLRGSYPLAATIYCGLMKEFYSIFGNK